MKRLLHLFILTGLFLSSVAVHSVVHADAAYDAGYQMGQAIAQNMFEPSMKTVQTEEYINQNYNTKNIKTIFLFAMIPDGFNQFIESRHAVENTTAIVEQELRTKGFQVITPQFVVNNISQNGINVNTLDETQLVAAMYAVANQYADATCKVQILSYRMLSWNYTGKAEATLEFTVTDQKNGTEIYSYTRQFIRANLLLAPNDPNKMVKKISKEFADRFWKKVSDDQKKF